MCGLVGRMDLHGRAPMCRASLARMNDRLSHRGPDGEGYFFAPGIALGHRRLAIIDPTGGDQPMYNETGSVAVVFNGCIYNFRELKAELEAEGHIFGSNCDTEVIAHAWEAWGPKCVTRFRGMFAIALWDGDEETLFLARDRLGKKPLYYAELAEGQMVFGSELKALLVCPDVRRELDPFAVDEFFAFGYIPDPRTIYRSVYKLPPAHFLIARRGARPRLERYWNLRFAPQRITEDDANEQLIEQLTDAVSVRLVSDVPLGAFLSGGVDSSAVVALMSSVSSDPVRCFSIEFGAAGYDETVYAREVAGKFGAQHTVDRVDPQSLLPLDSLISTFDEPFGDSSAVPTSRVCAAARRRVKVALSGDGGDEMFAGYRRYKWHLAEQAVRDAMPDTIRRFLFGGLSRIYPELGWAPRPLRARHTFEELALSPAEAFFHSVAVTSDAQRNRIFSEELRRRLDGHDAKSIIVKHMAAADTDDALSQALYADINTWLPGDILTKVDRTSMSHALEVRAPLLDHHLVEWAATLPSDLKLYRGTGKHILKRALEPILPKSILYRPKQGFSVPLSDWFRGPLRQQIETALHSPALRDSGLFSISELENLFDEHQRGYRDHAAVLWLVYVFEAFLRQPLETP